MNECFVYQPRMTENTVMVQSLPYIPASWLRVTAGLP